MQTFYYGSGIDEVSFTQHAYQVLVQLSNGYSVGPVHCPKFFYAIVHIMLSFENHLKQHNLFVAHIGIVDLKTRMPFESCGSWTALAQANWH